MSEPRRPGPVRSALYDVAAVSWRILVVAALLWLVFIVLGKFWYVVLPVILALLVTALLWPAARFLRKHKWPPSLAALTVVLGFLVLFLGVGTVIVVPVADQAQEVTDRLGGGLESVQDWLAGPPLNLGDDQLGEAIDEGLKRVQEAAGDIVSVVLGGITAIGNALIALVLIMTLVFFYLMDGPRFLPWLAKQTGHRAAPHVTELGKRYFSSLASFGQTQIIVGLIDAVFIGIGLLLVGVPLVLPLAVLTFIGAFIPIIGAFLAGMVAVLVALVSEGFTAALIVLGIIVVVQQLEGNVIAPLLQSKFLQLHPAVTILAVIAGSSLAGITGAFLAVPAAALIAITWRYARDRVTNQADSTKTSAGSSSETADAERSTKAATGSGSAAKRRPARRPK